MEELTFDVSQFAYVVCYHGFLILLYSWYMQALQEISVEDRKRQLENSKSELNAIEKRIEEVNREFKNMEKEVQEALKMVSFINDNNN